MTHGKSWSNVGFRSTRVDEAGDRGGSVVFAAGVAGVADRRGVDGVAVDVDGVWHAK
ncbi:MAG TPA: hypothetical protein VEL73_09915 [Mycobacteriales bacterium]|nr:hypothetical protein [Mycobacteriales bacterium]